MDTLAELIAVVVATLAGFAVSRLRRRALPPGDDQVFRDSPGHVIVGCMHVEPENVGRVLERPNRDRWGPLRWCPRCGAIHCGDTWREPHG